MFQESAVFSFLSSFFPRHPSKRTAELGSAELDRSQDPTSEHSVRSHPLMSDHLPRHGVIVQSFSFNILAMVMWQYTTIRDA